MDDHGGAYYTFATFGPGATLATTNATVVSIPDNNAAGVTSSITLTDARVVEDINVAVSISHSLGSQLVLTLIAPNGATVTLSNKRGFGANFTDTLFDDEAATPIASGASPFTGAFRPETPLSAVDGISAAGIWKLKVVDTVAARIGSIRSWTIYVTSHESCDPHATSLGASLVQDSCASGGPGNHDGAQDPGERVELSVALQNDGAAPLTGVSATLTPWSMRERTTPIFPWGAGLLLSLRVSRPTSRRGSAAGARSTTAPTSRALRGAGARPSRQSSAGRRPAPASWRASPPAYRRAGPS